MPHRDMRIGNSQAEIRNVLAQVEQFGAEHQLASEIVNDLNVALDEALGNIIAYGYESGARDEIVVRLSYVSGAVNVEIEDGGQAFDPLQVPPPDLTADLQDRKIGGLGIHFIRSLMNQVAYDRLDGKNRLRMVKNDFTRFLRSIRVSSRKPHASLSSMTTTTTATRWCFISTWKATATSRSPRTARRRSRGSNASPSIWSCST